MGTLVCNGSKLYRRTNLLVRTPISVTLNPVEMAYYSVAGSYNSNQLPNTGFHAEDTLANVQLVGYDCLQAYNNPTNPLQIWRRVLSSSGHLPETVWYQGAFATSAPNIAATYATCEAYTQLGAYKFQTPTNLSSLTAASVEMTFINGGAIVCYTSAGARSNNNKLWKNWPGLDYGGMWVFHFGVCPSLGTPTAIAQNPYVTYDIASQTGSVQGVRDLWGFPGTNRDGAIPTLGVPRKTTIQLTGSALLQFQNHVNAGVWIIPHYIADCQSLNYYRPFFADSNNGYWGCASAWGVTMKVSYE